MSGLMAASCGVACVCCTAAFFAPSP
jgi:hypothetical protein